MFRKPIDLLMPQRYLEPPLLEVTYKSPQVDSPLHILPIELLEIILQYLDGKSLVCLSSTCCLFYNLVNKVTRWEKFVLKADSGFHRFRNSLDLGLHFLTPLWRLSSSSETLHDQDVRDFPWKQIFYCGEVWSSICRWNFSSPRVITLSQDEITSMDIAGQDVVFGTRKGGLGAWNPDQNESSVTLILSKYVAIDQIFVQLSPDCGKEDLHYRVVIHCTDTSLTIYDVTGYTLGGGLSNPRDLRKISIHGGNLFEWDPVRGTTAFTIVKKSDLERCSDYKSFQVPFGPFAAVNIVEKLFVSQRRGPFLVDYDQQTSWLRSDQLLSNVDNLFISKAYIWPGQISFSLTPSRMTIISVGEQCNIIKWPPTFKCVSASLVADVLIVGTNVGTILFYPMKKPTDLLKLDPKSYHKKLEIGSLESIIYIGVRVQNHFHLLPDVVAATSTKLFCFRANGFLK